MKLAGIDLAWRSENNPTAISFGELKRTSLSLTRVCSAVMGIADIKSAFQSENDLFGVAIDAPLIINNLTGHRNCEKELSKFYGSRKASCHSSNLTSHGDSTGIELSPYLDTLGFEHLQNPSVGKFQIECYPHPAIIEIFGLPERLPYKKGDVEAKKKGQICLSRHIRQLEKSRVVSLTISTEYSLYLDEQHISSLAGKALKTNEDILDSIICLYIAGLFTISPSYKIYGSVGDGYIYVPKQKCVN